jgi:hypothetical protein
MLIKPKGYQYWTAGGGISENAPDWAKKEFKKYQELMKQSEVPNKDGKLINY